MNCFSGFKAFQNLFKTIWLSFSPTLGIWAQHKSFAICLGLAKTDLFPALPSSSLSAALILQTLLHGGLSCFETPKPFLLDNNLDPPKKDSEKLLTLLSNLAVLTESGSSQFS